MLVYAQTLALLLCAVIAWTDGYNRMKGYFIAHNVNSKLNRKNLTALEILLETAFYWYVLM
jgi:hypothetical protein